MTGSPASPAQRWTALFLFVVAPLVLLVLAAANGVQTVEIGARTAETSQQLARYRDRLQAGGVAELEGADLSPIFVNAGSRSLAEADLQRRIVSVIEAASARVIESSAGEVPEAEAGEIIEVRATLDVDNAGLLRFLHAVETGVPLMNVEELAVRRLQAEETDVGGNPQLRVDIRIRAHWRVATL